MGTSIDLEYVPTSVAGMWCWWDEAPVPTQRETMHGQITRDLGQGLVVLRYDSHPELPDGVQEIVSMHDLSGQRWSFFDTEDELRAAIRWKATKEE